MKEFNDTANQLLDAAERYTQMHGFNAFSYKDLQEQVGVKTSSIHYYFPTKQDLALSMTERYIERFRVNLQAIAQEQSGGLERLEYLAKLYVDVVSKQKFCMCGMLASDMLSLSNAVTVKLCEFFQLLEDWIAEAIELGKKQKTIKTSVNTTWAASSFLAVLEGGMLIARTQNRPDYLENIMRGTLDELSI